MRFFGFGFGQPELQAVVMGVMRFRVSFSFNAWGRSGLEDAEKRQVAPFLETHGLDLQLAQNPVFKVAELLLFSFWGLQLHVNPESHKLPSLLDLRLP